MKIVKKGFAKAQNGFLKWLVHNPKIFSLLSEGSEVQSCQKIFTFKQNHLFDYENSYRKLKIVKMISDN